MSQMGSPWRNQWSTSHLCLPITKRVLTSSSSRLPCCLSHELVGTPTMSSSSKVLYRIYPLQIFEGSIIKFRILKRNRTYKTLVLLRIHNDSCWDVLMQVHTSSSHAVSSRTAWNTFSSMEKIFMRCCNKIFWCFKLLTRIWNFMHNWLLWGKESWSSTGSSWNMETRRAFNDLIFATISATSASEGLLCMH